MKQFIFLILAVQFYLSAAQDKEYRNKLINRRTIGFSVQQGIPFYPLPEGRAYNMTGVTANYHQPFFKTKKRVNMGVDLIPELWLSYAHVVSYEIGFNGTINLNIQAGKQAVLAFHIGSGFHYFGMPTLRQAKGFAFANNFLVHYQHALRSKNEKLFTLGFIAGFRHLSNLSIKEPNVGIDNIILGICLLIFRGP
jgi:Lipid A 3-O-deacylase (PagL)